MYILWVVLILKKKNEHAIDLLKLVLEALSHFLLVAISILVHLISLRCRCISQASLRLVWDSYIQVEDSTCGSLPSTSSSHPHLQAWPLGALFPGSIPAVPFYDCGPLSGQEPLCQMYAQRGTQPCTNEFCIYGLLSQLSAFTHLNPQVVGFTFYTEFIGSLGEMVCRKFTSS